MSIQTVAVTGASGFIGSEIVDVLNERGYETVTLDRDDEDGDADRFLRTDLLDAGQTYGSLAKSGADAVVHMGTISSPTRDPGHVTFESNAMSAYHVLEAAAAFGLESACLASSVHAHGWSYQDAPPEIEYLPIDEEHPTAPRDPYALGKQATENLCDGFGRTDGPPRTLSTLRFPAVCTTDQLRRRYAEADRSLDALGGPSEPNGDPGFAYVHVRDAAELAVLAVEADYEGHETFWAVAPDTTAEAPTEDLIETFYPDVEVRRPLSGTDGFFDVSKARETVGWEPSRSWRDL